MLQLFVFQALSLLDEELRKNYTEILTRFYLAFESVHKYVLDLNIFLNDLEEGIYIQQSLESVMLSDEGKQLMVTTFLFFHYMFLHSIFFTFQYLNPPIHYFFSVKLCICMELCC